MKGDTTMNYTLMIAKGDYATLDLEKNGNKYVILLYCFGDRSIKYKEEFDDYDTAERRYLAMCNNSNVTPVTIEHDYDELYANCD